MAATRAAAWALAAGLAALVLAGCAHQPREFDVTPEAREQAQAAPEPVAADLSGAWEFDPRASDQPDRYGGDGGAGGRGMRGGRRGGMGGGMGGRGGYPGAGGMPGTGGDFPGSAGMPPRSGEPNTGGSGRSGGGRTREGGGARDTTLAAPRRLVLAQTDSSLTITRQGGASLTLFFDGRTVYLPDPRGEEEVQVSARWHAGRLQVRREATYQRVTRVVTESYELSKDGTRLTVRTRMSGDGQSQNRSPEIRRVYDRAAEPSPAPPPQPPPQAAAQRIGGR